MSLIIVLYNLTKEWTLIMLTAGNDNSYSMNTEIDLLLTQSINMQIMQ